MRKKIISIILTLSVLFCVGMSFSGCQKEIKTSTDGTYKFFYVKEKDSYAIVGVTRELPEILYIPAYFKGKEVYKIYHTEPINFGMRAYGLDMIGVKTAYLPFGCNPVEGYDSYHEEPYARALTTFIPCIPEGGQPYRYYYSGILTSYVNRSSKNAEVYFSDILYELLILHEKDLNEVSPKKVADYRGRIIKSANTAYMFNYEACPNSGYFFINDFAYGGKIEETPYEPMRKGYTFGGWYKEAECINEWDFETDTLPQSMYDEYGKELYQETKIYAKWINKENFL